MPLLLSFEFAKVGVGYFVAELLFVSIFQLRICVEEDVVVLLMLGLNPEPEGNVCGVVMG